MKKKINAGRLLFISAMSFMVLCAGCHQEKQAGKQAGNQIAKPSPSVYELQNVWQDQSGKSLTLSAFKGKIPLISMIFTRCPYACPRTIADLKNIQQKLPHDKRKQVLFVLVSFDDIHDTPDQLRIFSKNMGTGNDWILLHGDAESIRELAMVLGVKYKKQPDGSFTHSSVITLLDRNGAINSQLDGLGTDPAPVLTAINEL